jgi:YVTN family beta-propeller protein
MKKADEFFGFLIVILVFSLITGYSCRGSEKIARAGSGGVLIVANKSSDDVYFIDRLNGEVLRVLPTGREPHEVEVSDDGKIAVVCNYGDREHPGNTLSVYDIQAGQLVRTIDLGDHTRPHGMKWIKGTTHMLVTTEGSQHLLVVDIDSGEIIQELPTGEPVSHMVAATPDFSRAFVSSIHTGNVVVFDLKKGEMTGRVFSGAGAEGIAMHPLGEEVWVTNRDENTISVIDTRTLKVIETIPSGDFPIRAKFTPDGRYFLVSNARSGDIGVIEFSGRKKLASIKLTPPVPEGIEEKRYFSEFKGTTIPIGLIVPDNRWAYVANTRADAVSIIDLENMKIAGHFSAGSEPDGISFSPLSPDNTNP